MIEIFHIINFFKKYYRNFIFKLSDEMDDKINKSIMFMVYVLIIFIIIGSSVSLIPLSIIIFLLLMKNIYIKEKFDTKVKCRRPTKNNPFMNPLYEVDNMEACDVDEKEVLNKYYDNTYRNIKDVFDKNTGQLYYKTNNVTTIPNKYKEFLNFIGMTYDEPDNNCKYNGVNCMKYNDLRIR